MRRREAERGRGRDGGAGVGDEVGSWSGIGGEVEGEGEDMVGLWVELGREGR